MKFLVSGVGSDIGQSISRILSSYYQESEVIGSDVHAEFIVDDLFDRTVILPRASSPDYINCLVDLIEKERIDIFIPASETELRWFAQHRHVWKGLSCHCLMASSKAMKIGFDKLLTVQHLREYGLPSPWATIASDSKSGAPEIPCILKSRSGAGSSSVYLVDDQEKSLLFQKLFPDYIWQQYLPLSKGEFTCGVYRGLDGATRVVAMRRRLASGVTSFAEVINDPVIETLCMQIADSLELLGSINIQLRYVEGVGPMVFEINPRFSSTIGMRHKIGFSDLIWSIDEQFFGRPAPPCKTSWPNIKLGRRYEELIVRD
jgi:carbamoyl-phosphate synthase large subunit